MIGIGTASVMMSWLPGAVWEGRTRLLLFSFLLISSDRSIGFGYDSSFQHSHHSHFSGMIPLRFLPAAHSSVGLFTLTCKPKVAICCTISFVAFYHCIAFSGFPASDAWVSLPLLPLSHEDGGLVMRLGHSHSHHRYFPRLVNRVFNLELSRTSKLRSTF